MRQTALGVLVLLTWVAEAAPPDLSGGLPGRVRGGYMCESNLKLLPRMHEVGMNAALVKLGGIENPLTDGNRSSLLQFSRSCAQSDLSFLPAINLWGGHEEAWFPQWVRYVGQEGKTYGKTPCPSDRRFWEQCLAGRFAAIAEALRGEDLGGVLLDTEMYGADFTVYQAPCYCDACLTRFLKAQGREGQPLPAPAERAKMLKDAGFEKAYWDFQAQEVQNLATACREAFHQANPKLRIGVFHLDFDSPFLHGLARGFGTEQLPVVCLTERTYATGYDDYAGQAQKHFQELGVHVDLFPGLWHSKFPAANVAEQYYHLAKGSWGYWVYTMETFEQPDYSPLPGPHEDYWAGIQQANAELDKLATNAGYESPLQIRAFEVPPSVVTTAGFKPVDLVPLDPQAKPGDHPWLRGTNTLYFWARAGDEIDFGIRFCQIGKYRDTGQCILIAPDGKEMARGDVKPGAPGMLKARAEQTGCHGVRFALGSNACEVSRASHPYAAHCAGKGGAAFISRIPALYLLCGKGATKAVLWLETEGLGEAVQATIRTDSGEQLFDGGIIGPKKLELDLPAGAKYLVAEFRKLPEAIVVEDLGVGVESGLLPFAATSTAGLLRER